MERKGRYMASLAWFRKQRILLRSQYFLQHIALKQFHTDHIPKMPGVLSDLEMQQSQIAVNSAFANGPGQRHKGTREEETREGDCFLAIV